ncbi:hypothetical protein Tco_1428312 [Tanacetum coccineum]
MITLAKFMIIAGADNRPPVLEKSMYDSWKSCMELYIDNRENGRMILNSVLNGPLVWPTIVEENGTTRTKKYEELLVVEKLQANCDLKATNIVLQGLSPDMYAIVNHHKVAKEIWDRLSFLCKVLLFLCLLKEMIQLHVSSRNGFPATIQDDRVTVQQIQGRQGQSYAGTAYKGNATSSRGNNVGGQARVIEDLDAYDSDCDDTSTAQAVLMANLSNYDSDVILEEKANQEKNNESLTTKLERYKERVKMFEWRLNIDLSTHEKMIDSQMDDMIKEKLALKQQIDLLEQNLSNQIKEKESLLQTCTVFKNKSKEKESKYMDKEIDLEKIIKELDNIVYKVGQSAQIVHILHVIIHVIDDEETLILEEVSRSKMLAKQNNPISKEKKINTTPINYVELNRLSEGVNTPGSDENRGNKKKKLLAVVAKRIHTIGYMARLF